MARPTLFLLFSALCVSPVSCGVKGNPLPPAPATPEQSDRLEDARAARAEAEPEPSPSPTPSAVPAVLKRSTRPVQRRGR
jgi:hypothetical protein